MATPLGTLAEGDGTTLSHTQVAGSNRKHIISLSYEGGAAAVTCTYGGVACTEVNGSPIQSTHTQVTHLFFIDEDDLPADGANTIATTNMGSGRYITCQSFSDCLSGQPSDYDEAAPVINTSGSVTVTNPANGLVYAASTNRVSGASYSWSLANELWEADGSSGGTTSSGAYEIIADAGDVTVTATITTGNTFCLAAIAIAPASSAPAVTSADNFTDDATGLTVTGTDLDSVTTFTINSIDYFDDITSQTATTITYSDSDFSSSVQISHPGYGTRTLSVSDGTNPASTTNITVSPLSGWQYVTLTSIGTDADTDIPPNTTDSEAVNDQISWKTQSNEDSGVTMSVSASGTVMVSGGNPTTTYTFNYRLWDETDKTLSAPGTITVKDGRINSISTGISQSVVNSIVRSVI